MNFHDLFTYNPETGDLVWKERPRAHFRTEKGWKVFNSGWSGAIAGSRRMKPDGRKSGIYLTINGKCIAAHNIIWEMVYGEKPVGFLVDHVDCDQFNNRQANLRKATVFQNAQNVSRRRTGNRSGVKGVHKTGDGRWVAQVNHMGRIVFWKRFPTKGMAAVARAKMVLKYHGKFARLT